MFSRFLVLRLGLALFAFASVAPTPAASVWKVTGPNGGTIYLGGSIHGLDSTDYPLPSAYNRAFDATSALVIEDDPNVSRRETVKFFKSGFYSRGDSLKNHVDPRTYDYVRRVFRTVPEAELAKCKPWMLITMLWSGGTNELGVEAFLMNRARINKKPILGLESFREHANVLAGMPDKQAELVLLQTFIPQAPGTDMHDKLLSAWRRGDADTIARLTHEMERDLPTFARRLIVERNQNWIPKIERYLREKRTYFVVAGAAHMGGPNGVLALLKARGCRIEQL
ncbi:MAG: TraB/GumN family protein [Chthoniobacterales bacterium]|nr:TraB/GumN family protein [Chthoniobacterales bacterium]